MMGFTITKILFSGHKKFISILAYDIAAVVIMSICHVQHTQLISMLDLSKLLTICLTIHKFKTHS